MTRILVTNDDGIDSPGVRQLAIAAHRTGATVVVAAPLVDASGSSAAITVSERDGHIQVWERTLPGPDDADLVGYAVAAPPALITLIATRGAFGPPPDLVLSGINRGANTGHAILHSGTVGAALTAAVNGCPAMALSLDVGLTPAGPPHWEAAAQFLADLLPAIRETTRPIVLNVNAPDLPAEEVRGLREARLATFGAVQTNVEVGTGYVRMAVADHDARLEPGTDAALLADGYATVTAIWPMPEVTDVSLPHLARVATG